MFVFCYLLGRAGLCFSCCVVVVGSLVGRKIIVISSGEDARCENYNRLHATITGVKPIVLTLLSLFVVIVIIMVGMTNRS